MYKGIGGKSALQVGTGEMGSRGGRGSRGRIITPNS